MDPGDLVGLQGRHGPELALVLSLQGTKAELAVGLQATRQRLAIRELDWISPRAHGPGDCPQRLTEAPLLFTAEGLAAAKPRRRDLADAWTLLSQQGPERWMELSALAELLWSQPQPLQLAACWLVLHEQDLFRCRQGQIQPRSLADLRQLRLERRREALKQQQQQALEKALAAGVPLELEDWPNEQKLQLQALIDFAKHPESALPTPVRSLLQRLGVSAELGAVRRLLACSGLWQRHQLPALVSSPWSSGFDAALEAEAQALAALAEQPRPGDELRLDLTHLRSVTIDDPETRDLDDALALERCSDGKRWIWIHVADPDRLVPADSPLDREARRRASSLYLAQGTVPMFPSCLSEGSFSLQQGRRCACWSLAVELDDHGAIREKRLQRSWIQPRYRLSYSDADELIDYAPPQDDDLAELHELLSRRRHWRERQGALSLEQAEGRFRRCGDTACLEIVEPTPSRQMVAEAMILAGSAVAELGRDADLALPYRTQAAAPLPSAAELEAIPSGPARLAAIRKGLSRGIGSSQPGPHFSLGLQAYVQVTSPIRRYGDLVCQRQLTSLLQGGDRLTEDGMAALLEELEPALRQGVQISREDQRHWQQVWFAEHRHDHWQGLFLRWLRPGDGLALVRIDALAMELPVVVKDRCEPGDALQVQVAQSDPDADLLRLSARR